MQNSTDYINHVNIVKDLNLYNTTRENQKPYEDMFEAIYAQAKEADIGLTDAKDFLAKLSRDELRTLLENEAVVDTKLAELKDRAYKSEQGKEWYDWRNEDGKFNERFKSNFQTKYDNAMYAKEIFDKYGDKIFDNSILDGA